MSGARPAEGAPRAPAARSARGVFVAGTDTGIGKTHVAVALLAAAVAQGRRAVGMKPVAAGLDPGGGEPDDVARLRAAGNVDADAHARNPYAFAPAIAPHLAAMRAAQRIDLDVIASAYAKLASVSDVVVVEGAGGVLVPLDATRDMLDVPARLALPVALVVGIRLGCLNHALLSALAVRARGLVLAGFVANRIDPHMDAADDNVRALQERLGAPLLADLAVGATAIDVAALRALALV